MAEKNEEFGLRLRKLARQNKVRQQQLADLLGCTVSAVSRYFSGRVPDAATLAKLAAFFNVSVDFLLGRDAADAPRRSPLSFVPILGRIRAGIPLFAEQNVIGEIAAPDRLAGRTDFALVVSGDSMSGVGIMDGDIVYMAQADKRAPGHGDIVAALVGGADATLKWFVKENGGWWLKAANPKYDPIPVGEDVSIQGVYLGLLMERKPRELDPPLDEMPEDLLLLRLAERKGIDVDVLDGVVAALAKRAK